jgi:hypothetical protein
MNIDRITDNENHQKASKKRSLFNSLKPDTFNRSNLFIDEVNNALNNHYYMNSSNNTLITTTNLNQIRQEGYATSNNRFNNNHHNINNNNVNQIESNRCAVCQLL